MKHVDFPSIQHHSNLVVLLLHEERSHSRPDRPPEANQPPISQQLKELSPSLPTRAQRIIA